MAILGNIIKGFLDLRDKLAPDIDPVEAQNKVLLNLLEKSKQTSFGTHYNFDEILGAANVAERFSTSVPYFDYNKMNEDWWQKLHDGETNVTESPLQTI